MKVDRLSTFRLLRREALCNREEKLITEGEKAESVLVWLDIEARPVRASIPGDEEREEWY